MLTIRNRWLMVLLAGLLAGGCSLMPANGPASLWPGERGPGYKPGGVPYAYVRVTPEVIDVLARAVPRLITDFPEGQRPESVRFGLGDIVGVTIFESAAGGLFIPSEAGARAGNFVTIPNQGVDANGNITVPYAGSIRAAGRTAVEVQKEIVDALKSRAIEPQAVVSLVDERSSMITVLGDVGTVRLPVMQAPERILDVIARAGGTKNPGWDEWVMLQRHGKRSLAPFGALIYEPVNNIYVKPGDMIYVYREPQTFLVFGASGTQNQISFDAWRLSLAEALGKAGGLNDSTADPASVFVYRGETRDVALHLGADVSKFEGPIIPVIYNINLRDPTGYFLATKFAMRNKDVIYVSNSVSVEATKLMTFLQTINATIEDPIQTAIAAYGLKAAASGSGAFLNVTGAGGTVSGTGTGAGAAGTP